MIFFKQFYQRRFFSAVHIVHNVKTKSWGGKVWAGVLVGNTVWVVYHFSNSNGFVTPGLIGSKNTDRHDNFHAFRLVENYPVTPSSSVLTFENPSSTYLSSNGILTRVLQTMAKVYGSKRSVFQFPETDQAWSILAKRPDMQIARAYTPILLDDHVNAFKNASRFSLYLRTHKHGEVSTYLTTLALNSNVEFSNPTTVFSTVPRSTRNIVFLAGGTGITAALQMAETLLRTTTPDANALPNFLILWSCREQIENFPSRLTPGLKAINNAFINGQSNVPPLPPRWAFSKAWHAWLTPKKSLSHADQVSKSPTQVNTTNPLLVKLNQFRRLWSTPHTLNGDFSYISFANDNRTTLSCADVDHCLDELRRKNNSGMNLIVLCGPKAYLQQWLGPSSPAIASYPEKPRIMPAHEAIKLGLLSRIRNIDQWCVLALN